MNEDLTHEVPKYEEQGQQRGRKPQRLSPKAAAKRRAKGKESKKGPTKTKASKVAKSKVSKTPGKGAARRVRKGRVGGGRKEKTRGCAAHPSLELPRQLHPRQRPPCQRPHHAQAHPREHAGQSNLALRHLSLPPLRHLSFPAAIRNSQSSAFRMTQWKPQPIAHTMLSTAQPTVGHRQPSAQSLSVRIRESMPRGYSVCTTRFHQVCQGFPGSPGIKRTMSLRANLILVDNPKWVCKTNSA